MVLIRELDGFDACQGGIVSIGNFDGVHLGHQRMIRTLVHQAQSMNLPAIVFTFEPHPIQLLRPELAPPQLMSLADRAEILQSLGVNCVIAYPTNRALLNLTAEEFFQQVLCDQLHARGLVEGPNFYFGKDRAGDVRMLQMLCEREGMTFQVVEPSLCDSRMISSSEVRKAIQSGDVALAETMLGRPYQVQGIVSHGAERGRTLGFPTANLNQVETLLPADGVYCGFGILGDQRYPAAIHVGVNPTFEHTEAKVEVHLIGFSGEIYDQELRVELIERLRATQVFSDAEALKKQLAIDIDSAKKRLDQWKASL